jgi:hypothetical protein
MQNSRKASSRYFDEFLWLLILSSQGLILAGLNACQVGRAPEVVPICWATIAYPIPMGHSIFEILE